MDVGSAVDSRVFNRVFIKSTSIWCLVNIGGPSGGAVTRCSSARTGRVLFTASMPHSVVIHGSVVTNGQGETSKSNQESINQPTITN